MDYIKLHTFKNVVKITDIFEYKWVLVKIAPLTKDSTLLAFIKEEGWNCFLKEYSDDNIDVSVVIPQSLFNEILEKAMKEEPEIIFFYNLLNPINCDDCLQYSSAELIIKKVTDVCISVCLDENVLFVSVDKFLIQPKELYQKIRALQLDNG